MAAREEEVTFDRIARVYRDESQRKSLAPLEPDFWEKVARYVAALERDLAAEHAKDPNSKGALILQDELMKVRQKREQIYHYRERKIGLLATVHAGGRGEEVRGLTREEKVLLEGLVSTLRKARSDALERGTAETPPTSAPSPARAATPEPAPAPVAPAPKEVPPTVLVRVLEDMPEFQGPDGIYRLHKEDLVTLPPQIAKVLVDRGKALEVQAAG